MSAIGKLPTETDPLMAFCLIGPSELEFPSEPRSNKRIALFLDILKAYIPLDDNNTHVSVETRWGRHLMTYWNSGIGILGDHTTTPPEAPTDALNAFIATLRLPSISTEDSEPFVSDHREHLSLVDRVQQRMILYHQSPEGKESSGFPEWATIDIRHPDIGGCASCSLLYAQATALVRVL